MATRLCGTEGSFLGPWIVMNDFMDHLCETCLTPLIVATSHGITRCVSVLLNRGALPSKKYCNKCTALHFAVERCHESAIRLLLDHGADPNITNIKGETPLIEGIRQRHETTVHLLLERGQICIPLILKVLLRYMKLSALVTVW